MCGARSCYNPRHDHRPHHSLHSLAADGDSHGSREQIDAPDTANLACEQVGAHQPLVGYSLVHQLTIRPAFSRDGSYVQIETSVQ